MVNVVLCPLRQLLSHIIFHGQAAFDKLIRHPDTVYEGVLPLKIKNEVILRDWVSAIIAPMTYYQALMPHIPEELKSKVHFVTNDCKDIWEWSEKVYEYVKKINGRS